LKPIHPELDPLSRGFRDRYLSYDELTSQLRAWAEAFPQLVSLRSLGQSPEGRELWLLVIGPEPERARPAVWVDGNMHAVELAGSSVALAIAEEAIALHLDGAPRLPSAVLRAAKDALFYVMPRMSPDGAESILTSGRYVRSVPRDERTERGHPRWISDDIDGDGASLLMRKEDPTGEFVAHPSVPGLVLARELEDEGPYYKLYPEGRIEHFDGHHVPDPDFLGDNSPDLNRNFPWFWAGEDKQKGSGPHPGSEIESRAVIELAARTPNLFAWVNLHTFGGVQIRPPGNTPDSKMNQSDLAIYRQLEAWSEELCGYPMVGGFEEFLYEPDQPLRGTLSEWAYEERGCLSFVTELWDIFPRLGVPRPKKFADYYVRLTRGDLEALAKWDAEHNARRIFRPFVKRAHPQLGEVEIGGIDTRVGLSNPPYEALPELCEQHSAMFLRIAAMVPRVKIARVSTTPLADDLTQVEIDVENHGYLPTHGVHASAAKPWNEPLWAELECGGATSLVDPGGARREVGHLLGWGRGRFDWSHAIFFQRSLGTRGRRTVRWLVRGRGPLVVSVGSSRVGTVTSRIDLGAL
jgi:hypothetical protein